MIRLWGIVGLLSLSLGCGGGDSGGGSISSAPLAGTIGGQAWSYGTGESNSFLSDSTTFWVDAYSGSFTPCTDAAPTDGARLILTLPKAVGTHGLGFDLSQTFYLGDGTNLVAISGTIAIDSVTSTTISGGARFSYNAENAVDGQFTATICP